MDYYLDIQLHPDPEFSQPQLMSALFSKLHRALVNLKSQDLGVSFPKVRPTQPSLGDRLRVHGTALALQNLMSMAWLNGIRDHIKVTEISPVPEETMFLVVRRVQTKSSPERLRRRQMRRKQMNEEEAILQVPDKCLLS